MNSFFSSSGSIDSDDDIFITATADDINLGANLTADGNVDLDSTNGNVLFKLKMFGRDQLNHRRGCIFKSNRFGRNNRIGCSYRR